MLVVKQNLGLMYAGQNLSELAISHLNEVCEKCLKTIKRYILRERTF